MDAGMAGSFWLLGAWHCQVYQNPALSLSPFLTLTERCICK